MFVFLLFLLRVDAAVLNIFGASGYYTSQYLMRISRRIWRQQDGGSRVASVDILNYIQVGFTVLSFAYDPSPCILQEIQSEEERVYAEMERQAKYLELLHKESYQFLVIVVELYRCNVWVQCLIAGLNCY